MNIIGIFAQFLRNMHVHVEWGVNNTQELLLFYLNAFILLTQKKQKNKKFMSRL